jgi:hypothetical protein
VYKSPGKLPWFESSSLLNDQSSDDDDCDDNEYTLTPTLELTRKPNSDNAHDLTPSTPDSTRNLKRNYTLVNQDPSTPLPSLQSKRLCINLPAVPPIAPLPHLLVPPIVYPIFKLVPPPPPSRYYTPLQAVKLIINNADLQMRQIADIKKKRGKYDVKSMTKNTVINIMIKKNYIPVKSNAMYKLLNQYQKTGTLAFNCWIDCSTTGVRPHLSEPTVQGMIDQFKNVTQGGAAKSKADLIDKITTEIKREWSEKYGNTYKSECIPEPTLRKYINRVMGQKVLNIFKKVSNKTESRAAAELSIRSTVSYLMTVLTTHFINASPSKWHKSAKECKSDPLYQLVKKLNI